MKKYLLALPVLSVFNAQATYIDNALICKDLGSFFQLAQAKNPEDFSKLQDKCFDIHKHHEIVIEEFHDKGFAVFHSPNSDKKFYTASKWIKDYK